MPIAFSVWDGLSRERGSRRGLSLWFSLYVEPENVPSAVGPMTRTALVILAIVLAVATASFAAISWALVDARTSIDPSAVQALNVLSNDYFWPLSVGVALFGIGYGLAIVGSKALPLWLGVVALLLGIIGITPLGFLAFIGLNEAGIVTLGIAGAPVRIGALNSAPALVAVFGFVAIAFLLRFLRTNPTTVFIAYRIVLAAVIVVADSGPGAADRTLARTIRRSTSVRSRRRNGRYATAI